MKSLFKAFKRGRLYKGEQHAQRHLKNMNSRSVFEGCMFE